MPFETGMEEYLDSFKPVKLRKLLSLPVPRFNLKKLRNDVTEAYKWDAKTITANNEAATGRRDTSDDEEVTQRLRINYANGSFYEGALLNGVRHGQGTLVLSTKGHLYKGAWKDGRPHGQACFFTRLPDKAWALSYAGQWQYGFRQGWGVQRQSETDYYEGYWDQNKRSGWGRFISAVGDVYEGRWKNDLRNGMGLTRFANGDHHYGEYLDDKRHGPGRFFFSMTGKYMRGVWKHDIPVECELKQLPLYKPTFPHQYILPISTLIENSDIKTGLSNSDAIDERSQSPASARVSTAPMGTVGKCANVNLLEGLDSMVMEASKDNQLQKRTAEAILMLDIFSKCPAGG